MTGELILSIGKAWLPVGLIASCFGHIMDGMLFNNQKYTVKEYIWHTIIGTALGFVTIIIILTDLWEAWKGTNGKKKR